MKRTKVDQTTCIGCALCEATCPNSYKLDDAFLSQPLPEQLDSEEMLIMSIEDCPVGAISADDNPEE